MEKYVDEIIKSLGYDKSTVEKILEVEDANTLPEEDKIALVELSFYKVLLELDNATLHVMVRVIEELTGLEFDTKADFVKYVSKALNDVDKFSTLASESVIIIKRNKAVGGIMGVLSGLAEAMESKTQG